MGKLRMIGDSFRMGGVSVTSSYDRIGKFGHLNVDIKPNSTPDQIKAVVHLTRQFLNELEGA